LNNKLPAVLIINTSGEQKNFYFMLVFILVLNIASASIFDSRYIPFVIGIFLLTQHIVLRRVFSVKFIALLILWVLINVSSILYFDTSFYIERLIINTINLLFLPYLLIVQMRDKFWPYFESIVYLLTLISLPLFFANILFPGFFNSLVSIFSVTTTPSLLVNENYWSALIYVNSTAESGIGVTRNCGFMWEPGAFAMIIVWGIIYNWYKNGLKFNRKTLVYIIALLTTFSTAGYLAMLFLFLGFNFRRANPVNFLYAVLTLLVFTFYLYELEFLSGKIEGYFSTFSRGSLVYNQDNLIVKGNRFQGIEYSVLRTIKYPFGHGLSSLEEQAGGQTVLYGTNGLGMLLEMWGVLGFIFLMFLFKNYFRVISNGGINAISAICFFLALVILFFSNPIARNLLFYFIIMSTIALPEFRNRKNRLLGEHHER